MRSTAAVLTLLVALPALAGCLTPSQVDSAAVAGDIDVAKLLPYMDTSEEHDHAAPHMHDAGWNVDVVGWDAYTDDATKLGRYNHVQLFGDYAFVSVYYAPPDMRPGVVVLDVSDHADPEVVAFFDSGELVPIDVHLSEDGKYLAIAGHRFTVEGAPSVPAPACTATPAGPPLTICQPFVPYGIQVWDVSDPTSPRFLADYLSAPSGAHTVKLRTIDGELYAFIASYGVYAVSRVVSGVEIVRLETGTPRPVLVPVSRFLADEPSGESEDRRVFVHDMVIEEHPVTGDLLMYVSYWDGGVVIADVGDPSAPKQVAAWKDFDVATYGNIHYARPFPALIDGKHVTVAAPEFGSAEHAGEMYVVDTTDPAAPKLLGRWQLPGNPVNAANYMHSPHNFDLTADGLMVYAHYHAGIWVLDLNEVIRGAAEAPAVLGYRFTVPPAGANATLAEGAFAPNVWNALWAGEDRIVASDIQTGLFTLKLATREPGAPPYAGLV